MESFLSIIDELTVQTEEPETLIKETTASPRDAAVDGISGVSFYSSLLITSEIGEID